MRGLSAVTHKNFTVLDRFQPPAIDHILRVRSRPISVPVSVSAVNHLYYHIKAGQQ